MAVSDRAYGGLRACIDPLPVLVRFRAFLRDLWRMGGNYKGFVERSNCAYKWVIVDEPYLVYSLILSLP